MKQILIVYYTQTGQIKEILDSITEVIKQDNQIEIDYWELLPETPFPFPWKASEFFDAFPESVLEIPCQIKQPENQLKARYDLVILGYQPWYLSPSIPIASFFNTECAKTVLNGTPVITVLGTRNMWIQAQERIKTKIANCEGTLVGNIVLEDKAPNLISVFTIARWLMKGQKKSDRAWLPDAGVSDNDIRNASRFGASIINAIKSNTFNSLQTELLKKQAVVIHPTLMSIEKRGIRLFGLWAKFIRAKGGASDPKRRYRRKMFEIYLYLVIYLISPFAGLIFSISRIFIKEKVKKQIEYYSGCNLK